MFWLDAKQIGTSFTAAISKAKNTQSEYQIKNKPYEKFATDIVFIFLVIFCVFTKCA